ncbi:MULTISPECIES: dermonecrotic toxin domain-containing protein [unclassified Pseudomonas]|uniref:dermonecrotic toxin domain-containing protein n=1 Tax=unclassified Pseudomonas TaxID=196821 RepID=UPI00380A6D12
MPTPHINAAGVQLVRNHLATLPRPDREAKRAIGDWLSTQGVSLDPDQIDVVTLNVHAAGVASYQAVVAQRLSLTQAVLTDWQGETNNDFFGGLFRQPWAGQLPGDGPIAIVDKLPAQPIYDNGAWYEVFNGLFKRTEPARYDHSTLLDVRAEALQSHVEALDFHTRYKASLDTYWHQHLPDYRLCCKLNFIAACNKQVAEGSLSDGARKLAWRAAELIPRGKGLRLSTLSIYGYAATDLLYINDASTDLTLLYAPGNSSPLLEFASEDLLKDWVGQQCKDGAARQALKQHFRLADGPQGIDFSGLDTALEGLGAFPHSHRLPPEHGFFNDDGIWPPRTYVNYRPRKYNPKITGDLFQAMAERQRQRCYDDADFLITRNSDTIKSRWTGYLNTALNLLAPLTFVVPGLAPLLALGGIVQLGLGLDQAINGKTLQDKQQGIGNITYGLLNATPLAIESAAKADALFIAQQDGFVAPRRFNDQWGYPLSPVSPPHLPDLDVAPYFHRPAPIAPLQGGDAAVANSLRRYPRYDGNLDSLVGYVERTPDYPEQLDLVYDMQSDLFITEEGTNEVSPTFYEAEPETGNMRVANPAERSATDAMRTASLRALGIDVRLPLQIPGPLAAGAHPIPKLISSLWVGNKRLSRELLDTLTANAGKLRNSPYHYRMFLSKADPQAFTHNLAELSAKVPGLQVLALEEQPFFTTFANSKYYAQYQAALDGNGGVTTNFASASDVLRYPMLHSEGGLYMDVDDALLSQREVEGTPQTDAAIDTIELKTTDDGLLLHPPMKNEKLGMNTLYNSSMIGSHAGNPTLLAISEEMHARYLADGDFYKARPTLAEDPRGFYEYAHRLSELTGPAMLNAVIDRTLPDLFLVRQLCNLYLMPRINTLLYVEHDALYALQRERLPLNRLARVGGMHSWANT